MALRITNSIVAQRTLADLQRSYAAMARTQEQIASGYRVNRPSDDPLAAGMARLRQNELDQLQSAKRGVESATAWLSASETALSSISSILARARELVVQGANDTMSPANRIAIADEIDALIESAKDALNVKVGDRYIFAGTATTTPPYSDGTGDAYQGNNGAVVREIGPGVTVQVNPQIVPLGGGGPTPLTADAVLGSGGGDGRVLDVLRNISQHLRNGTPADIEALRTTDLAALEENTKAIANARAAVGTVQNRVDAAADRIAQLQEVASQAYGDLVGTDLIQALTDIRLQEAAYQSALSSSARIIQPSLMDFLR